MTVTPEIILTHPWYLYTYSPDNRHKRYAFRDQTCLSLDEALTYAAATRDQAEEPPSREENP